MTDQNVTLPLDDGKSIEHARIFWLGVGEDLVRHTPKKIEGAAKQMIAAAGILVGLYFNAVTLSGIKPPLPTKETLLFISPIALLLLSLTCSLLIFIPNRYKMEIRSPSAAELIYRRSVKSIDILLSIASVALLVGIFLILAVMWTYLS